MQDKFRLTSRMTNLEDVKNHLAFHQDFPKKGITFVDIFPIFRSPLIFDSLVDHLVHHITLHILEDSLKIDVVVGLEARGFLLGPIIALRLGAAFVPVRKAGKLPGECVKVAYDKEYGEDVLEMQLDAIKPGQNVVVIDDLLATGGSARATGRLVANLGGKTLGYLFIMELVFLKGASKVDAPVYAAIQVEE